MYAPRFATRHLTRRFGADQHGAAPLKKVLSWDRETEDALRPRPRPVLRMSVGRNGSGRAPAYQAQQRRNPAQTACAGASAPTFEGAATCAKATREQAAELGGAKRRLSLRGERARCRLDVAVAGLRQLPAEHLAGNERAQHLRSA